MASRTGPRSVADATRFTSARPQASSKSTAPGRSGGAAKSKSSPLETPEQRVARLRAAHIAARNTQLSTMDRVVERGRRAFDVMQKVTVAGLVGFTVIAGAFSVYAVVDMVQYNRKRRADFIEAQRKMEADSLAAARLAFINGTATDDQILLVEQAIKLRDETGTKLPPLLAPSPTPESSSSSTQQQEKSIWDALDAKMSAERMASMTPHERASAIRAVGEEAFAADRAAAEAKAQQPSPDAQKKSKWWPF